MPQMVLLDDEAEWLQSLTTIEEFNEAMVGLGKDYRLVREHDGGFTLEREGEMFAEFPECSEGRAAWCAYFFLRGVRIAGQSPDGLSLDAVQARN